MKRDWSGWLLIGLAIVIWSVRPLQSCSWWNIVCSGTSVLTSTFFGLVALIVLILGIRKVLK